MPLTKKRIQVVMVDEHGVEHVVSTEDAPAQASAFGESERASIKSEVLALAAKAASEMGLGEFRYPQIIDHIMKRSAGGIYKPIQHVVWMNMLLHKNPKTYRKTLVHEVAHAVVFELMRHYRSMNVRTTGPKWSSHGAVWKTVIKRMGDEPEISHTMDVVAEMPGKWLSQVCTTCGYRHQVGKRKLANAIAKRAEWRCGTCNRPLDMNAWTTQAAAGGKRRHGRGTLASAARGFRAAMRGR